MLEGVTERIQALLRSEIAPVQFKLLGTLRILADGQGRERTTFTDVNYTPPSSKTIWQGDYRISRIRLAGHLIWRSSKRYDCLRRLLAFQTYPVSLKGRREPKQTEQSAAVSEKQQRPKRKVFSTTNTGARHE